MSILVISGPSGAGKSTLIKRLLAEESGIYFSISHTTRKPRENEVDGKNYFFINKAEFEADIENGYFLEWAKVHECYYGSSLRPVKKALEEKKLVLFDIDVQGFFLLKKIYPDLNSVFITTKDASSLKQRLLKRADTQNLETRLLNAKEEMSFIKDYDALIINDEFEKSYEEFKAVVKAARLNPAFLNLEEIKNNWNKGE